MEIIKAHCGSNQNPCVSGYLACFNQGRYREAHDVLELLWHEKRRQQSDGNFYQGLIQLAGAFYHWEKGRVQPAVSLLKLAHRRLEKYSGIYEDLDPAAILALIQQWITCLESGAHPSMELQAPIIVRPLNLATRVI